MRLIIGTLMLALIAAPASAQGLLMAPNVAAPENPTVYVHVNAEGVVDNRALFDGGLPADWPDPESWIMSDIADIGWLLVDGELVAPPSSQVAQ